MLDVLLQLYDRLERLSSNLLLLTLKTLRSEYVSIVFKVTHPRDSFRLNYTYYIAHNHATLLS